MKVIPAVVATGVIAALGLLAAPTIGGQQPTKIPRIGIIRTATTIPDRSTDSLHQGLRDLGYVDGQTITLEIRYSDQEKSLPELAKNLVTLRVDMIVAAGAPATLAVRQVDSAIPIVMMSADPVGAGLVGSLARPGREHHRPVRPWLPRRKASGWAS